MNIAQDIHYIQLEAKRAIENVSEYARRLARVGARGNDAYSVEPWQIQRELNRIAAECAVLDWIWFSAGHCNCGALCRDMDCNPGL